MTTAPDNLGPMSQELKPDREGRMMAIGIAILFGMETIIIVVIMLAVGARPRDMLLVLALVIAVTAGVFYIVTRVMWIPWQRKYPKQPVLAGAVSKSMQSFAFPRLCWFNNCLRITVDKRHLHVCPFIVTVPFGAKRISIPWQAITDVRPGFWPGTIKAKLDGRPIAGPSWCLQLADDAADRSSAPAT